MPDLTPHQRIWRIEEASGEITPKMTLRLLTRIHEEIRNWLDEPLLSAIPPVWFFESVAARAPSESGVGRPGSAWAGECHSITDYDEAGNLKRRPKGPRVLSIGFVMPVRRYVVAHEVAHILSTTCVKPRPGSDSHSVLWAEAYEKIAGVLWPLSSDLHIALKEYVPND